MFLILYQASFPLAILLYVGQKILVFDVLTLPDTFLLEKQVFMEQCDFLVIGAGIAGASAAAAIAPHGQVIMAERENIPGYHTTGRSAAFYAETYGNEAVRKFTSASKQFFLHPPKGFSDIPLVHDRGALFLARADQQQNLDLLYDQKSRRLSSVKKISPQEVSERAPLLRPDYAISGVWDPECRDIDVHSLHQGFLRTFKASGGRLLTNAGVLQIRRDHDHWQVRTKAGEISARYIVNAAGAWADEIAMMASAKPLGIVAKRRTVITFDAPAPLKGNDWPLILDVDDQFYLKPENGHILASPGDATPMPPQDAQPDELDIALAVDRLTSAFEFEVPHIDRKWAGLRTFAPDDKPIVGWDPTTTGFFWCAGQGGYGMQTAPAISQLVAALATHAPVPDDLQDFGIDEALLSPDRFRR